MKTKLVPALAALALLFASVTTCSDLGHAVVALDLEVTVVSETGVPIAGTTIWLEDHGLPPGTSRSKARHKVCTTGEDGKCRGQAKYSYSVRHWPWDKHTSPKTSATRFELLAEGSSGLEPLGFLPPMASDMLHGAESVAFQGTLEGSDIP